MLDVHSMLSRHQSYLVLLDSARCAHAVPVGTLWWWVFFPSFMSHPYLTGPSRLGGDFIQQSHHHFLKTTAAWHYHSVCPTNHAGLWCETFPRAFSQECTLFMRMAIRHARPSHCNVGIENNGAKSASPACRVQCVVSQANNTADTPPPPPRAKAQSATTWCGTELVCAAVQQEKH